MAQLNESISLGQMLRLSRRRRCAVFSIGYLLQRYSGGEP